MATVSEPTPGAVTTAERPRLSGRLGAGSIVFMVVAAAAPLTVVAGSVPIGIFAGNGPGYPAMYIVASIVLLFFAVGFTTMTKHVPNAGAFYSYIGTGLGRGPGLGGALLALISYTAVQGAVYGYLGFLSGRPGQQLRRTEPAVVAVDACWPSRSSACSATGASSCPARCSPSC